MHWHGTTSVSNPTSRTCHKVQETFWHLSKLLHSLRRLAEHLQGPANSYRRCTTGLGAMLDVGSLRALNIPASGLHCCYCCEAATSRLGDDSLNVQSEVPPCLRVRHGSLTTSIARRVRLLHNTMHHGTRRATDHRFHPRCALGGAGGWPICISRESGKGT